MAFASTPADRNNDFQRIAVGQGGIGMRAAGHDFAIELNSDTLALVTQLFKQAKDSQAGVNEAVFAIQGDVHASFQK